MTESNFCPHCNADLRGNPIPVHLRDEYYGGHEFFKREIGIELSEVYDGILFWKCPDCGKNFHRFPEGDYRRDKAEKYINK